MQILSAITYKVINKKPKQLKIIIILKDKRFMAIFLKKERFNERLFYKAIKDIAS